VNDEFIDLIGEPRDRLAPGIYLEMMIQLHEEFRRRAGAVGPILKRYLARLDDGLAAWLEVLR
jgi:hypothetical protein